MKNIKILVCDLDGTLLNDQKKLSDYSVKMLKKAKDAGIKICFASGRDAQMMSVYSDIIGGCNYLISCNGALVNDFDTNRIIHKTSIGEAEVSQILEFLAENDIDFTMYTPEYMYYKKGAKQLEKRITDYEEITRKAGFPKSIKAKAINLSQNKEKFKNVLKIVAYEKDENKLNKLSEIIRINKLYSENTGYGLKGVFAASTSKKTALEKVIEDMNINYDNVCVFGDYGNDLSMFECAKYKVAVANAVSSVKKLATHVTDSNNDDGVAKFIEKILAK